MPRWREDPGSATAVALSGVALATALVLTFVSWGQWALMHRALEGSSRAWIVLEDVPETPPLEIGHPVRFPVRLVNAGRSPAQDLRVGVHAVIGPPDADPLECRHAPDASTRSVLGPGQRRTVVVETPAVWQPQVDDLEAGAQVLRVCGVIDYQDGFRTTRLTRFCLDWDAATGRFGFCPRYNEIS